MTTMIRGGWRRVRVATRRNGARRSRDRGQATAELAVAVIGLVAVLAPLLAGVQLLILGARAQEGARAVAREIARGDSPDVAAARVPLILPGASTSVTRADGDAIVTVSAPYTFPFGATVTVSRTARTAMEQP